MTDEQRLQAITNMLILVRDNLFRGMSKSIQKIQAKNINEVLELPNYTESPQRPWQGLTEEEVQFYIKKHSKLVNAGYDKVTDTNLVAKTFDSTGFYKEVSAVLKERNT
jgi:hypothetical protein